MRAPVSADKMNEHDNIRITKLWLHRKNANTESEKKLSEK